MRYRWNEWILDQAEGRLSRRGQPVNVSRKVLHCICHLVACRERVVGYDELIRTLWGHGDASQHQLSQIILAARRLLGDDRNAQRVIRTATGRGYQWVAPVEEIAPGDLAGDATDATAPASAAPPAQPIADAPSPPHAETSPQRLPASRIGRFLRGWNSPGAEAGSAPEPHTGAAAPQVPRGLRLVPGLAAVSLAAIGILAALLLYRGEAPIPRVDETANGSEEFAVMRKALSQGLYDDVREALSVLPAHLAESEEARLITIDLAIQRGRYGRAADKLQSEFDSLQASRDPAWKAQLLIRQSVLKARQKAPGAEVFEPADSAVRLLQSLANEAPPQLLAEALRARANGYNLTDRSDDALRDVADALDIHEHADDARSAAIIRASRARTWMRMGRIADALDELSDVAETFRRLDDRVHEVLARNTLAKIQIESLQWQDAAASTGRSMQLLRDMHDSDRRYATLQLRALALVGVGRMREAGSLLEEAEATGDQPRSGIIPAIHHIEAGQPMTALESAASEFETSRIDTRSNLLLENREGALLLWVMAAQALAERGETPPTPSAAQRAMLEAPTSPVARIARGRWLLLQGEVEPAERELRDSLQEAQALNQRLRMVLAAEPLLVLALRQGEMENAQRIVDDLHGYDPDAMERDYRFSLLRLRIALAGEDAAAVDAAHRHAGELAGERTLPHALESLYVEHQHREGGPLWSGPIGSGER